MEFFAISATKVNTASRYPKFFSSSSQPESKRQMMRGQKGKTFWLESLDFTGNKKNPRL
jgi:hypothetical protein